MSHIEHRVNDRKKVILRNSNNNIINQQKKYHQKSITKLGDSLDIVRMKTLFLLGEKKN